MDLRNISWPELNTLLKDITKDITHNIKLDRVVCIHTGGWEPTQLVNRQIGEIPVEFVRIQHYNDVMPPTLKYDPPRLITPLNKRIDNQRVLLIDDFANTGKTIQVGREHLYDQGATEVQSFVIASKANGIKETDYYAIATEKCVKFPWRTPQPII